MSTQRSIGLVGYGRIGQTLADRIKQTEWLSLGYACDARTEVLADVEAPTYTDPGAIDEDVDLVVEAATAGVVKEYGADLLASSDLLTMSTTAFADEEFKTSLADVTNESETNVYIPHGAILGMDGLQDGRPSIDTVSLTTRKSPKNIDFSSVDVSGDEIDEKMVLYKGATRGICSQYPRNVNSHATVALAGLGFDKTQSILIADQDATEAVHHIVAEGEGVRLEVERSSAIEGVTGSYTLDSIWGTVVRILDDSPSITVV